MTVTSTPTSTTSTTTAASSSTQSSSVFGSADASDQFNMFLKLLTTQMQNQDPLSPMDSAQYTQQLAQYSQVEQSIQQTGLLKDMLSQLGTRDMSQAASMIGRVAEFSNSVSALSSSSPAQWRWTVPQGAATMTAEISDSSGKVVATPAVGAGETSGTLQWNGQLADGSTAPPGAYSLKLTAQNASGADLTTTVHSAGQVQDVTQRNGELWLGLGGSVALPLSDLIGLAASA